MSSISMLSEITRGALDPEGWQPLIDARPDWFEVIHLYGIKAGSWRRRGARIRGFPLHFRKAASSHAGRVRRALARVAPVAALVRG